jgi:cyclohexanecarboxyl-CoA dehydrogenase
VDFELTEEQRQIQKTVQEFARKELLPRYTEWDQREEFPREILKKMGAMGFLGLTIPEPYGGAGADSLTAGLVVEALAYGDINCAALVGLTSIMERMICEGASQELKAEWVPALLHGERIVCFALTEPQAGSDAAAIKCRAVPSGSEYILSGEKNAVSLAAVADAAIVIARTDPAQGAKGIDAFLVPLNLPGVVREKPFRDMGCKALTRGPIVFEGVRIPVENRLGQPGTGFVQTMKTFDFNRVLIALLTLGAAQASLDQTLAYVAERSQFGRPLAKFEGVSFPLAEAATKLEAGRWLCYRTLWLKDHGLPYTKESAMCKWWVVQTAVEIIHQCLLLHGHYGYSNEYKIEQRLRDAIGYEIGDGTAQIMKLIIVRELLGREFLPYV